MLTCHTNALVNAQATLSMKYSGTCMCVYVCVPERVSMLAYVNISVCLSLSVCVCAYACMCVGVSGRALSPASTPMLSVQVKMDNNSTNGRFKKHQLSQFPPQHILQSVSLHVSLFLSNRSATGASGVLTQLSTAPSCTGLPTRQQPPPPIIRQLQAISCPHAEHSDYFL